jgi:hypothetical protein
VAFFKCRSFLIERKAATYAEQHQGMYALMRGAGAALVFGFALYMGVAIGAWFDTSLSAKWMFAILLLVLVFAFIAALGSLSPRYEERARRASFWMIAMVLLCGGVFTANAAKAAAVSDTSLPSKLELNLQSEDDPVEYLQKERALLSTRCALQIHKHEAELMLTLAAIAAVLVPLCLSAFRAFAANFAATVYRDFSRLCDAADPGSDADSRAPDSRTRG